MAGYKTVVGMVNGMLEELNITVPVALHLDHGSYDGCLKCVEAGFSSIMFDGSHYPIDENVAKTTELVKIAHDHGMSLEAEVGAIGGEESGTEKFRICQAQEEDQCHGHEEPFHPRGPVPFPAADAEQFYHPHHLPAEEFGGEEGR